jgi:hypothetical protein
MKSRLLIILLFYVGCQNVIAQTGNYFLSHYAPAAEKVSYPSFDMVQGKTGVIYFAGQSGVMKFDGRNWDLISTKAAVYTLSISDKNDIYFGGVNGFGKTGVDEYGLPNYQAFSSDKDDAKNIFASLVLAERAYFLKDTKLFIVNIASEKIEKVIPVSSPQNLFTTLFEIQDKVYVGQEDGSLLLIESPEKGEIKAVKTTLPFAPQEEILFTEKSPSGRYLIVAASGRVWINETSTGIRELKLKDSAFLVANVVVNGAWVNDDLIALGTLRGGILFADPQSGDTQEISNFFTGLPDNEVVAIMGDRSQGLWVTHAYGFTRIAPYLPFRTFNHYEGIEGNLLCAISFQNQVYVGTTLGLYKLDRLEMYEDEVYYVDKPVKGQPVVQPTKVEETVSAQEERAKTKRGLFGFKKRAAKEEKTQPAAAVATPTASTTPKKPSIVKERRTRKVLKGISYAYKKVNGINGKVTQLLEVDGKLTAAGASGVFEITESTSKTLIAQPVRTVFYSPALKQVFASTYEDNMLSFNVRPTAWVQTTLLDTLHDHISYIFEDHLKNIWLCAMHGAYKAETSDDGIFNVEFTPYAHATLDESVGFTYGKNVYIATQSEFDLYNSAKSTFSVYKEFVPKKILASGGAFWFNDGHEWRTFDEKGVAMKLEWLKLFPDIRFLAPTGEDNSLWVITSKNELYKFTAGKAADENSNYPLFLREVRGKENKLAPSESIEVGQLEGALAFEFIQPDFVSGEAVEYQYRVIGMSDAWSGWSSLNNVIPFPYLTPGTYELNVESKNLFGKISQLAPVHFKITPPWWKQLWFYALEFFFFGALVLLSMQLGAGNSRYRFISRLLSLLTVIMLIQFIQTAAQSLITIQTNPVMDFFIQVAIALVILPLEGPLRKFMEASAEGKYELSRLKKVMSKSKN